MKGTLIIYKGTHPKKEVHSISLDALPEVGKFFHFEEEVLDLPGIRMLAKYQTRFPVTSVLTPTLFENDPMWARIIFKTVTQIYCLEFEPFDELCKILHQQEKLHQIILTMKGEAES